MFENTRTRIAIFTLATIALTGTGCRKTSPTDSLQILDVCASPRGDSTENYNIAIIGLLNSDKYIVGTKIGPLNGDEADISLNTEKGPFYPSLKDAADKFSNWCKRDPVTEYNKLYSRLNPHDGNSRFNI